MKLLSLNLNRSRVTPALSPAENSNRCLTTDLLLSFFPKNLELGRGHIVPPLALSLAFMCSRPAQRCGHLLLLLSPRHAQACVEKDAPISSGLHYFCAMLTDFGTSI